MIINLSFSFFNKKSDLYLCVIHFMTCLHLAIEIWTFWNYILNFKKFQAPQILNYECFVYVDGKLSSFTFFSHQFLKI
jgi:hypothetical protein